MADLDSQRHTALELLRPACISLMKDITNENVKLVIDALGQVDAVVTQEIQQYIVFPIQNALHLKSLPDSLLGNLCEALVVLFSKTELVVTQMFFDVFNPLIYAVISPEDPGKGPKRSEDTKISLVRALTSLFKACSEKVLTDVYSFQNLPALGQLTSLQLQFAELEKSRELQIGALDCMLVLLQTGTKFGKTNEVHLGDFFAFCLPGVTMATCRIITGDSKQGHAVLTKAMCVWCRIVVLVLSDDLLRQAQENQGLVQAGATAQGASDSILEKLQSLKVKRDDTWVETTASKVDVLIGQIGKLVSSSNWRVRLSLAELCEQVLMSCYKSLTKSVPKLLECLVGMIGDEYGNVAKKSMAALQTFSQGQSGTLGESKLLQILEENLYSLTTSLPRQMKMCDEEDKPALINLLNGYITLLGPNIHCVIYSYPHLSRLCLALVQILELDPSDIRIVEEKNTLLDTDSETLAQASSHQVWKPRKNFKNFHDENILTGLMLVCRKLGEHGNLLLLVDHLLDVYQESAVYRLAVVLMINEMVVGAAANVSTEEDKQILQDVISMLIEEYLSPSNRQLVDSFSDDKIGLKESSASSWTSALTIVKPEQSLEQRKNLVNRNRAVLLTVLFLEGLGRFAQALGTNFQKHLITALYPLVENMGHENVYISSAASAALLDVAPACGYQSLDIMIRDNVDYLVSSVSVRLRHLKENRRAPRTICVMLRHCSHELLPLIDHSVTELLDSLDDHYTEELVLFMPVLLELTAAIGRWFPPKSTTQPQIGKPSHADSSLSLTSLNHADIDMYVEEFKKALRITQSDFTDEGVRAAAGQDAQTGERTLEDIEADMQKLVVDRKEREKKQQKDEEEMEEERKKPPPKHVQVLKEVLQRIKNLLSSHDGRLQVQALDIVCQACQDLRDHQNNPIITEELLPQIHELWSGFCPLFRSQEKFIVIKAVQTLVVMSEVSRDFIKQRTMKDVLPGLISYMDQQGKISSGSRSAYLHTTHHKLQLGILSSLGTLARNLQLQGEYLEKVANICLPYLSNLQPETLQKAVMEAFTSFIALDTDAMWFLLCETYCPLDLTPPAQAFRPVKFPNGPGTRSAFSKNITELFRLHYS